MEQGQAEMRPETNEALRNLLPFLEKYQGDSPLPHVKNVSDGLVTPLLSLRGFRRNFAR